MKKFKNRITKIEILSNIRPYEKNARTHDEKQIKELTRSIKRFGWINPIIVDENNIILAGHGRFAAAEVLNSQEVPVIQITDLNENQKKAYRLADNKLALNADWDFELLQQEIMLLMENDFDIGDLGWTDSELNDLLNEDEPKPSSDKEKSYQAEYLVVCECEDEKQQNHIFNLLREKGLPCKIMS